VHPCVPTCRAEKWQAWEKGQEQAEEEEARRRRQELAAQAEARRKKIEELRKQQQIAQAEAEMGFADADKINRQVGVERACGHKPLCTFQSSAGHRHV
jgi:uncharacterized protein YaiL (DUF2058 family)